MAYYEDIVIKDGQTLCKLCDVFFPDDDDNVIECHINGKNHKVLYKHRLNVQNNIINSKTSAYCRICKENVLDETVHVQNRKHREQINIINNIVEKDGAFIELPQDIQDVKVKCTICDRSLEFTLESIRDHTIEPRHRRARAIAVQPFNGIFSVEGSNDDMWCKICQVYFENYIETIFEHVDEDKDHNVRLTKLLRLIEGQNITMDNFLTNATEDKATCNKCNTGVACNVDNLERHIKGKRHRS